MTSVSRTVLDLAAVLPAHQVERAINEAEVRRLRDRLPLTTLLERYPGRRGVGVLAKIVGTRELGMRITRSELEDRFVAFLKAANLPSPQINTSLHVAGVRIEVDCLWRASRLIVELDGHAFHARADAFERDRARDRALSVAGWRVVRVTWRQLHDEPAALAADLRDLLA